MKCLCEDHQCWAWFQSLLEVRAACSRLLLLCMSITGGKRAKPKREEPEARHLDTRHASKRFAHEASEEAGVSSDFLPQIQRSVDGGNG